MKPAILTLLAIMMTAACVSGRLESTPDEAPLPPGVWAEWGLAQAFREATPTRERVCINGLWRWQPAGTSDAEPPAAGWGWFKVPGCWPGITDYMQKDFQTLHAHPRWKELPLSSVTSAWYEREVEIPAGWQGRRILLTADCLNSYARVFLDGRPAGEMRFPAGELDLTSACRPGAKHLLTLRVDALPLKAVMLSYTDSAAAREVKGTVERRGLCGDVVLESVPSGPRIESIQLDTSVRRSELTVRAAVKGLQEGESYALHTGVIGADGERVEFAGPPFGAADLQNGRITLTRTWRPKKLWDLHTPENRCRLTLNLRDEDGRVLDSAYPLEFGFRELWIDGRDFYLNGSRIFLSAVPLDNAQVGAALASYEGARESLLRLKSFGINFVYAHNYGCEPGSHLSFAEILRAADDVGMLVALTQPHFSAYDWKMPDADRANGYAAHARYYAGTAGSHPSVVAYATSHNATGYSEDMNPDMIDGIQADRDSWAENNAKLAMRAEALIRAEDPGRIVYHHASGNLGAIHSSNFYPNFVPAQELSDWFEHWAARGVKPAFLCEYGAPFTWDWTMYRGWYQGKREFGSARVPWEFCLAEWNAQFLGDRAYRITEMEKANLRWEAQQFREGRLWHRWDYPFQVSDDRFDDRHEVIAQYLADNWRAFRTWGVSGISPWEHDHYWRLREGVDRRRRELTVDWGRLQRPGFSPDFIDRQYERFDLAFRREDWIETASARAIVANNRPLLAWIGGKPAGFTEKGHNFYPGETVEKQLILINNSRETVTADCSWTLALPKPQTGSVRASVPTGEQKRIPLRFALPAGLAPGRYRLTAEARIGGETQRDTFDIHVLTRPQTPRVQGRIALFDPKGETRRLLQAMGVKAEEVSSSSRLSPGDLLIVGKGALTLDGPFPDVRGVRNGLRIILFEQRPEVLEQRLGFRVVEYGLRKVHPRIPDHPVLAGIRPENLRDWRGEATLLPPRLSYVMRPMHGPTVKWCGIDVTRPWRCGNRGNVASVLIEKPAGGDFLPILDGGYALQYSPLLEYREGQGMILFCQLDVTGRTALDPAADNLARRLLEYASGWKPSRLRAAAYHGGPQGLAHLKRLGLQIEPLREDGILSKGQALVLAPGGGTALRPGRVRSLLESGGAVLALGLNQTEAETLLPFAVTISPAEHIAAYYQQPKRSSLLAGIGPAEAHNRDPRILPLITGGAVVPLGDGVLAESTVERAALCQILPWQLDSEKPMNQKRTFRRASFLLTRLLGNMGVSLTTPLLERFAKPAVSEEKRWLEGFYLDIPEEWDDPYRFFRW